MPEDLKFILQTDFRFFCALSRINTLLHYHNDITFEDSQCQLNNRIERYLTNHLVQPTAQIQDSLFLKPPSEMPIHSHLENRQGRFPNFPRQLVPLSYGSYGSRVLSQMYF